MQKPNPILEHVIIIPAVAADCQKDFQFVHFLSNYHRDDCDRIQDIEGSESLGMNDRGTE